jgi:phospholipid transport system transporter-binding protein
MQEVRDHGQRARLAQLDADTLAVSGELTFASAADAFADGGRALAAGRPTRLDLRGITRADSAGLACLLALAVNASRAGRRLAVVNWPEGLRSLAEVCDVADLLEPQAAVD